MPVTKVLCVAEKPSIAKAVANHLSGNHTSTVSGLTPQGASPVHSIDMPNRAIQAVNM